MPKKSQVLEFPLVGFFAFIDTYQKFYIMLKVKLEVYKKVDNYFVCKFFMGKIWS